MAMIIKVDYTNKDNRLIITVDGYPVYDAVDRIEVKTDMSCDHPYLAWLDWRCFSDEVNNAVSEELAKWGCQLKPLNFKKSDR